MDSVEVSTMIRSRTNNHRHWSQALFALVTICTVLGFSADRVAADPLDNLEVLDPHHGVRTLQDLRAILSEFPIIIGPVPGVALVDRSPRQRFSITAATPRGPRAQPRRPVYRIIFSALYEARAAEVRDSAR
jgi:hypothetical protein